MYSCIRYCITILLYDCPVLLDTALLYDLSVIVSGSSCFCGSIHTAYIFHTQLSQFKLMEDYLVRVRGYNDDNNNKLSQTITYTMVGTFLELQKRQ